MIVSVKIVPIIEGARDTHNVSVQASISPDGSVGRSLVKVVARIGPDGKDRAMTACLEEAFAEILKQALS